MRCEAPYLPAPEYEWERFGERTTVREFHDRALSEHEALNAIKIVDEARKIIDSVPSIEEYEAEAQRVEFNRDDHSSPTAFARGKLDMERPTIPDSVFESLPQPLRTLCSFYEDGAERDVFLTAALTVCSGILSCIRFKQRKKSYHVNLFGLVTAPAGSGKGDAERAWELGSVIHKRLLAESKQRLREWEERNESVLAIKFRNRLKERKGEPLDELPEHEPEPPLRKLRIAVNSSSRAIADRINANNGGGVFFDTETGTFNNAQSQDWGQSLEIFLKGSENESVSLDRKGGDSLEIERPCFSMFLSGTPKATGRLLPSAENGLFSRFLHYSFDAPPVWKDQRPSRHFEAREAAFASAAESMNELHRMLEGRESPLHVTFSDSQWDRINTPFQTAMEAMSLKGGDSLLLANIKRSALSAERIACILAVLRHFNASANLGHDNVVSIEPNDTEVASALDLSITYLAHAIGLAKTLKERSNANLSPNAIRILHILPESGHGTITTKEIAQILKVDPRSVQRYLKEIPPEMIVGSARGPYARVSHVASVVCVVSGGASSTGSPHYATETTQTTSDNIENEYGDGKLAF